jgi:hypothetical protein
MLGSKRRLGLESCRDIWSGCVYNAREAGRAVAGSILTGWAGGKSELHRVVCPVTRGARMSTESATENIPPINCCDE